MSRCFLHQIPRNSSSYELCLCSRYLAMDKQIDPHLTEVDLTVLQDLLAGPDCDEQAVVEKLSKLKQEPTVFCTWDAKDLPSKDNLLGQALQTYTKWAQSVVRSPNDVVFLTHILLYFTTSLPSALLLYRHFSWTHGVLHFLMQCYYSGSFTLMLHNCIHQNGLLSRPRYALADRLWPYILEPLFGHTWDSYFYHHVKHHHVEGNGPDDLSSTLRYQRDELSHFAMYVGRFLFFIWLELPLYFLRKRKTALAAKAALSEFASYAFLYAIWSYEWRPTLFVLVLPFCLLRLGLMVGNFGQHALVDDVEPDSDFRSSITLIDVPVSSAPLPQLHQFAECHIECRLLEIVP